MTEQFFRTGRRCVNLFLKRFDQISCGLMMAVDRERRPFVYQSDYIRASALELAANEIYDQNIPGNAAELGVYRGDFAKLINEAFPDRILYLWVSLKTRLVFRDTLQFSA